MNPLANHPETAPDEAACALASHRELAETLEREGRLLHELREALIQQRAAVAASDAKAVDSRTETIGRILWTLGEARSLRRRMISGIAGEDALSLDQLERWYGPALPARLSASRVDLRRAAEAVAIEVSINRAVLKRATEIGDGFLQALFSSGSSPVYAAVQRKDEGAMHPSVILNKVV